ncbi:unnamed protein product [Clonostachys rhizophaga]|uniref:Uncharacterized protein n=1 Tax=Clonostachys rhizophaga TaxID=160324 RepID=A0A9N9VDT7_9HYPO|nr:unnamed protein product [Clonostachys rhizophaga]
MFHEIERDLIRPGISEKVLKNEIYQLGATQYGIEIHWHKRLVRSGSSALRPFQENPPDRIIGEDDILVIELDDPHKKKIRNTLDPIWNRAAEEDGWSFGADLAGHLVGSFPHEHIPRDKTTLYNLKGNKVPMSTLGKNGKKRHWILEIHLQDHARGLATFYEQLLTAG